MFVASAHLFQICLAEIDAAKPLCQHLLATILLHWLISAVTSTHLWQARLKDQVRVCASVRAHTQVSVDGGCVARVFLCVNVNGYHLGKKYVCVMGTIHVMGTIWARSTFVSCRHKVMQAQIMQAQICAGTK